MGRHRVHLSSAERQAAYRERQAEKLAARCWSVELVGPAPFQPVFIVHQLSVHEAHFLCESLSKSLKRGFSVSPVELGCAIIL